MSIPSPVIIKRLQSQIPKETILLKIMTDLMEIHQAFNKKVDELQNNIQKQKGPKGDNPSHQELLSLIKQVLPYIVNPELENIKSSLLSLKPKDGKTPSKQEIEAIIKPLLPKPKDVGAKMPTAAELYLLIKPFLTEPKPEEIAKLIENDLVEKTIEKIVKEKKIKADDLEGYQQTIRSIWSQVGKKGYLHGGGDTVRAGTNVTIVTNADGTKTISASGGVSGSNVTAEVLVGVQSGDDVTLTFSGLSNTATSIISIARNGKQMTPGSTTIDGYTLTGVVSATVYQASEGDTFLITYAY